MKAVFAEKLCFKTLLGIGLFLALPLLIAPLAEAKVFRNNYVSFEIPETWNCNLENTEYVCKATADKESKEAIIVLTAKEVGPTDTLDAYISHLNTPQTTSYKGKQGGLSKVIYPPKRYPLNDQIWIDGLQLASEVPNYFTRYLATIKDRIAILFTCSAHKDFYTKYTQDFFKAVQSLRVIASKNLLNQPENGIRPGSETLGAPIGGAMPEDLMAGADVNTDNNGGAGGSKSQGLLLGLAILLAGAGAYIFLKSRKK